MLPYDNIRGCEWDGAPSRFPKYFLEISKNFVHERVSSTGVPVSGTPLMIITIVNGNHMTLLKIQPILTKSLTG